MDTVTLQHQAKVLVLRNLRAACSDLIRHRHGLELKDDSVLHQVYGVCLEYVTDENASDEMERIVTEAAVCAIAGGGDQTLEDAFEVVKRGYESSTCTHQ